MLREGDQYLNYSVSGKGHPVVFLHGFLESMTMWDFLDFPENISQIRIDLPGHGSSLNDKKGCSSMKEMAEYVKYTLQRLNIDCYDIVGHSMGGYVALELIKIDKNCQKVVLMNSNFWSDDMKKQRDRKRVAEIVVRNKMLFLYEAIPNLFLDPEKNTEAVQGLIKEAEAMNAVSISEISIAMSKRNDLSELVTDKTDRILVIQGVEDSIVPVDRMRAAQMKAGFAYKELSNCGHMAHVEQPNEVIKATLNFLG